jgi:hypothetical protein
MPTSDFSGFVAAAGSLSLGPGQICCKVIRLVVPTSHRHAPARPPLLLVLHRQVGFHPSAHRLFGNSPIGCDVGRNVKNQSHGIGRVGRPRQSGLRVTKAAPPSELMLQRSRSTGTRRPFHIIPPLQPLSDLMNNTFLTVFSLAALSPHESPRRLPFMASCLGKPVRWHRMAGRACPQPH